MRYRWLMLSLMFATANDAFGVCGTLTPLRPNNIFVIITNANGICGAATACNAGEVLKFSLQPFGPDLTCVPHTIVWDFGDGTQITTSATTTTHVYAQPGLYHTTVTVAGADTLQLDGSGVLILTGALALPAGIPTMAKWQLIPLVASLAVAGFISLREGGG